LFFDSPPLSGLFLVRDYSLMDKIDDLPPVVLLAVGATGLAVLRSLAKANIKTIAIVSTLSDVCCLSKYPIDVVCLEGEDGSQIGLLDALASLSGKGYCLTPTSDLHVEFIVEHYEWVSSSFVLVGADKFTLDLLLDKALESNAIKDLGLELPKTWLPSTKEEATLESLSFPAIIKSRRNNDNPLKSKNIVVSTESEWFDVLSRFEDVMDKLIVQEVIPGQEDSLWISSCTFDRNHSLVSIFSFQRLAAAPKLYGVTSQAVSRHNDQLEAMCQSLGERLKIVGNADVEFKMDERDGRFKYIEINPRIGMCGWFDTCSGVNSVLNGYYVAIDRTDLIEKGRRQKDGVILLDLYEDTFSKLKSGMSFYRVLMSQLRYIFRRHVSLYFALRDPRPALFVYKKNILALARSLKNKVS
jgi:predicted ATP-grasp superfamily ATP-dependent carboligase